MSRSMDKKQEPTSSRKKSRIQPHKMCMGQKFPFKLWDLLGECKDGAIQWSDDGTQIQINSKVFTSSQVVQKYFISKWSSFVRQLNLYGFRKVLPMPDPNSNDGHEQAQAMCKCCSSPFVKYVHEEFRRDNPGCAALLTRQQQSKPGTLRTTVDAETSMEDPFTDGDDNSNDVKMIPPPAVADSSNDVTGWRMATVSSIPTMNPKSAGFFGNLSFPVLDATSSHGTAQKMMASVPGYFFMEQEDDDLGDSGLFEDMDLVKEECETELGNEASGSGFMGGLNDDHGNFMSSYDNWAPVKTEPMDVSDELNVEIYYLDDSLNNN